ncbi:MAG: hypothetical protein B6U72_06585 [Candidatus Altiarchaeales archaeon ex4484_2]|nr:MAG: hypothetical protein B6U72_06585 [Candidatus Altiarchaeales archaeon ex4484_2]
MNKKGYFTSPFMLAFLILLTAFILLNHSQGGRNKTRGIMLQGKIVKEAMEVEETRQSTENIAKFITQQAVYETSLSSGNQTLLEQKITDYLNEYTGSGNNYSIETKPEDTGFMVESKKHPVIVRDSGELRIESSQIINFFSDCRFYPLINLSKEMNHSLFQEQLTANVILNLGDEFNLSLTKINPEGSNITIEGGVNDSDNISDGGFMVKKILEEALISSVNESSKIYPKINELNYSLVVYPQTITSYGLKKNLSGRTLWCWHIHVYMESYIVDSTCRELGEGLFNVSYRRPLFLLNGSIKPLKYNTGASMLRYNLLLESSEVFHPDGVKNYTGDDGTHKPSYVYKPGGGLGWIG